MDRERIRRQLKRFAPAVALLLFLSACQSDVDENMTPSFEAFLKVIESREPVTHEETGDDGILYRLGNGILTVFDKKGDELWRSKTDWWVDDFRLGDVDGDGNQDFLFSLWKSYRFGDKNPSRMENDDETVRNHLFLYTVINGHMKSLWGSSDLPRPVYRFELDSSGEVTVISSGILLLTEEGEYRDDFVLTETTSHTYAWEGWGFVPKD